MFLKKVKVTSNGSRNIKKLTSLWLDKSRFSRLTWRKKSQAGRTSSGRISVWTKGSLKTKLILPRINYSLRSRTISLVSTFKLIPFQNKLVALAFTSSGGISYLPAPDSYKIFSLLYFPIRFRSAQLEDFWRNPTLFLLFRIKRLSQVSLLELFPGAGIKYIRSSGSTGKLISFDYDNHTAVVQLPSGVRKIFSIYSIASMGSVSLSEKKYTANTKAGYWKTYGKKSIVRGVAMNPVDHPHGGRTKSIKYPRTPWGKTTKFKN